MVDGSVPLLYGEDDMWQPTSMGDVVEAEANSELLCSVGESNGMEGERGGTGTELTRLADGGKPAEERPEGGNGAGEEGAPNEAYSEVGEGEVDENGADEEGKDDEAGSGWMCDARLSVGGFALRFGLGDERGSGPATAERRSKGSSDASGPDGERGEALRIGDGAKRSAWSSWNSDMKEEGAAVVPVDIEFVQLDIVIGSEGEDSDRECRILHCKLRPVRRLGRAAPHVTLC